MRFSPGQGITALCLIAVLLAPHHAGAAGQKKAKTATAAAQTDDRWPRLYVTPSGANLVVYTPQVATWENQNKMTLYAAVAYEAKDATTPAFGSVKAEVETKVALDERLVEFSVVKVTDSSFPSLGKEQVQEIVEQITAGIPQHERVISLDRVLAAVDRSQIIPKNAAGVKADPPVVFFSKTPAVLLNVDGEPVWSAIANNDLKYAVNTNWDVFQHPSTNTLYLRDGAAWLKASTIQGPWTVSSHLPGSFTKLPSDDNWKEVRSAIPPQPNPKGASKVFVSLKPAELILLKGEPQYVPVGKTDLLWVSNTDSDVFRLGANGSVYYLVSGRWFSAPDFSGPWTFATPALPPEFAKIPLEHERSRVLASVPGTPQAAEAVLLAQIPQTARVNKKTLAAPEVAYQGDPKFEAIPNTTLAYARNTDKTIIKAGESYYMCFQGVWFEAKGPSGPWEVASSLPPEIYEIPMDSPVHNVTYVTVAPDDNGDDEWVEFAATAAYEGTMVAWGCAVWGDGYYYPPYLDYWGGYPIYYPYYPTYGYGARYNPWTGAYTRGAFAYGPYGGAGVAARYNPRTGTYSRGAAVYGPAGGKMAAQGFNPRTGTSASTRQSSGVYRNWGTTSVQRGDQWARTAHVTNKFTGNRTWAAQGSQGNVYAGRDGNVYRKQGDNWQKFDNGSWNSVGTERQKPGGSSTLGQLDRDSSSRAEGSRRAKDSARIKSGSSNRTGSFRASPSFRGGGRMGGGGFGRRR